MPELVTTQYIKDNFEHWEGYCTIEGGSDSATVVLERKIDMAEVEIKEYAALTTSNITDQFKRHILNITRKNCFDIRHADAGDFDVKPQIVKDYETTLKYLQKFSAGGGGVLNPTYDSTKTASEGDIVSVKARTRMFTE